MDGQATIKVNFTDGTDYSYTVKDVLTAKKYAHSIITQGFRVRKSGRYIYYPVHEIKDVEVLGEDLDRELLVEKKG